MGSIHLRVAVVSRPVAQTAMPQHPDTYVLRMDSQDPLTNYRMCDAVQENFMYCPRVKSFNEVFSPRTVTFILAKKYVPALQDAPYLNLFHPQSIAWRYSVIVCS